MDDHDLTRAGREHLESWVWVGLLNVLLVAAIFAVGWLASR